MKVIVHTTAMTDTTCVVIPILSHLFSSGYKEQYIPSRKVGIQYILECMINSSLLFWFFLLFCDKVIQPMHFCMAGTHLHMVLCCTWFSSTHILSIQYNTYNKDFPTPIQINEFDQNECFQLEYLIRTIIIKEQNHQKKAQGCIIMCIIIRNECYYLNSEINHLI